MAKVSKEEIKKIAEMTRVSVADDEIESIMQQFNDVISYAEQVVQVAQNVEIVSIENTNVVRLDIVIPTDSSTILAQAPAGQDQYFVVPKFLDN